MGVLITRMCYPDVMAWSNLLIVHTSRKHLHLKVTPDLHLTYSKNGGSLGLVLIDKSEKFSIKLYVVEIY